VSDPLTADQQFRFNPRAREDATVTNGGFPDALQRFNPRAREDATS